MWRTLAKGAVSAAVVFSTGCMTKPLMDNPLFLRGEPSACVENPVFVPLGPPSYGKVFECCLDTLDDYFEISYANRYDGRIETFPRVSPGIGQPWRHGSPGLYQRVEATFQSIRRRATILIQPADDGGYFVQVVVFKELEDVPQPTQASAGAATFRSDNTVERQNEVIDATIVDGKWAPIGRDACLEQIILHRLKKCM